MYSAIRGLIRLNGTVAGPRAAEDIQSYCVALNEYYACLKLRSQLQSQTRRAKAGPNKSNETTT